MRRALLFFVLVVGCAAQKSERAAPSSAPPPKASDYDGTEDKAGADSTKSVTPSAPPMPGSGGGATGTAVMPEQVGKAQASFDDAAKVFSAAGADCAQLCKALHSMTHATERLCDLTQNGPATDQQRCTDARTRLDAASAKVKSSCGNC